MAAGTAPLGQVRLPYHSTVDTHSSAGYAGVQNYAQSLTKEALVTIKRLCDLACWRLDCYGWHWPPALVLRPKPQDRARSGARSSGQMAEPSRVHASLCRRLTGGIWRRRKRMPKAVSGSQCFPRGSMTSARTPKAACLNGTRTSGWTLAARPPSLCACGPRSVLHLIPRPLSQNRHRKTRGKLLSA